MNKTLIKNFAIDARVRLIQMAIDNAGLVGIAKDKIDSSIQKGDNFEIYKTIAGTDHTITGNEIKQRESLVKRIKKDGFENVMEMTAYTWFNRIIAIRYMEVNDYLPTRVRVLSSETAGKKEPDIITMAPDNVDLNFTSAEKELIRDLKAKQKMDEAFRFLFIKQCNELNKELPKLFEKTTGGSLDYTELLFSLSFIQADGVVARLLEIDEDDFKDQVQIIGWMYQYYNTELKDDTFAKLKKNIKITKERIPAATQLFTPDWIVRYMVENSLGRLYIQNQNAMDEKTVAEAMGWKYYLPQAEQTEEVQKQLDAIKQEQQKNGAFNLETIKVLDPCMGSGHILVYAFDVLVQMYKNAGYNERDAATKIMQNNIFGLDIDNRAAQLAYFALMMKGRQYDRRFFERDVKPNTYAIQESNGISEISLEKAINASFNAEPTRHAELVSASLSTAKYIIQTFKDAKEYGSIIDVEKRDYDSLKDILVTWKENHEATLENVLIETDVDDLIPLCQIAKVMSAKYDVVVTNPPYMGASGMGEHLSNFVKKNYEDYKSDLFSAFIIKCLRFSKKDGILGFLSPYVWMFIQTYEKLRKEIIKKHTINNLIQFEYSAFEEAVVPICSFTLYKHHLDLRGTYIRLTNFKGGMEVQRVKTLEAIQNKKCNYLYTQDNYIFKKISGSPIAYWWKNTSIFDLNTLDNYYLSAGRNKTHNNNLYVRNWWEIYDNIRWQPYSNGGAFRRWAGNDYDLVDWSDKAKSDYASHGGLYNQQFNGKTGICWNLITSYKNGFRLKPGTHHYSSAAPTIISKVNISDWYVLAFLNSVVTSSLLEILNPTLNTTVGDILSLPFRVLNENAIIQLSKRNYELSKSDWDSFETSWDFAKHPLV